MKLLLISLEENSVASLSYTNHDHMSVDEERGGAESHIGKMRYINKQMCNICSIKLETEYFIVGNYREIESEIISKVKPTTTSQLRT